jgi:hypothetical protein
MILWHVDLLLAGDRKVGDCTAAVARRRRANYNREVMFFLRGPLATNEI